MENSLNLTPEQPEIVEAENPLVPTDVSNLRWADAEKTCFTADITLPNGDQFSALVRDGDLPHVQAVWDKAMSGDYGVIGKYVPPVLTDEERRQAMPVLQRWQFNAMIDLEVGLRDKIMAGLNDLPEPRRTVALSKMQDMQVFSRTDSLMDEVSAIPDVGKTPKDIDTMWEAAPH
ncbi:hypothetical protein [Brucella anthropi]|uniref:hypothetical protein n=1 Tax=Brucella anthropi TaxID=529 RepID=UPI00236307C8|nr:hypothetical protein [Brucella anthropi]